MASAHFGVVLSATIRTPNRGSSLRSMAFASFVRIPIFACNRRIASVGRVLALPLFLSVSFRSRQRLGPIERGPPRRQPHPGGIAVVELPDHAFKARERPAALIEL